MMKKLVVLLSMTPLCLISVLLLPGAARSDEVDPLAAALVLGGLVAVDDDINEWVRNNNNSNTVDNIAEAINFVGSPVGLYLGTWYAEHNAGSKEAREYYRLGRKALESTGVAVIGLKYATGRSRPSDEKNGDDHFGPSLDYDSFPSGHSASAFALAKVMSEKEPDNKKLYYGAATLVGLSRIYQEKHHTSDVFAGALLGHYVARYTLKHKRGPLELRVHF